MREHMNEETSSQMKRPAGPDAIPAFADFVSTHARELGFHPDKVREIGEAIKEAVGNIVRFACADGMREISVRCTEHEMGPLVIDIRDSGDHFNMLVVSSFSETADFVDSGQPVSTSKMKKTFKNIEYRRDGEKGLNILVCVVPK